MKWKTIYFHFLLALAIIFSGHSNTYAQTELEEVRELIEDYYVEDVSDKVMEQDSAEEIVEDLDVYSSYMNAEEYSSFMESIERNFTGIGVVVSEVENGMEILTIFEKSPAENAGLQVGDILIEADGTLLEGKALQESVALVRGEPGTKVNLKILRPSTQETFEKLVAREAINIPTVEAAKLAGDIGYIRLHSFNNNSVKQLKQAVKDIGEVNGWIFDVRDNGGGYLDVAQQVVGMFPGADTAVIVESRDNEEEVFPAIKQDVQFTKPVHLLINGASASASEILAGALNDQNAATLYGRTTYGKGTVQLMFELDNGGALKLTNARFYSPNHNPINKVGIEPDVQTDYGKELVTSHRDMLLEGRNPESLGIDKEVAVNHAFSIKTDVPFSLTNWENNIHLYELGGKEINYSMLPTSFTATQLYPEARLLANKDYLLSINGNKDYTYDFQTVATEEGAEVEQLFTDVPVDKYFAGPIHALHNEGIVNGVGENKFMPYHYLTKQDAAVMFARALKLDLENIVDPGFADVDKDTYYYKAIAAVAAKDIFRGDGLGNFGVDRVVTREEMAAYIARAFNLEEESADAPFKDVQESPFKDDIARIYHSGITTGSTETTFAPNKVVTRAQFATFLYRAFTSLNTDETAVAITDIQ